MNNEQKLSELRQRVAQLITSEKNWEELLSVSSEIIKLAPEDDDAYVNRGGAKVHLGDFQGAIDDFNKALEIDSNIATAYANRGSAKVHLGDFQGAIDDYNKALEIDPTNDDAYVNRGVTKKKLGDYNGAIDDYNKALEIDPTNDNAYVNRGVAKRNLGDYNGAIDDYNKALEIDPKSATAYVDRSIAKEKLGDFQGAIDDCNKALEIDSNSATAYVSRGVAKGKLDDFQGAIDDHTKALEIDPENDRAHVSRGVAKGKSGDFQGAIDDFNKALYIDDKNVNAYVNRGVAKINLGDTQGAIDDYNKALEINPKNDLIYVNRGVAKRNLGDTQGAFDDYNKALEINPKNDLVYVNRGVAKINLGDTQGAFDDYNKALEINPKNDLVYVNRGVAKINLGDTQGAFDDYNKALEINPKNVNAYANRSINEYKLENYKNSIKDADKVMELDKTFNNSYILVANMTQGLEDETRVIVFEHIVKIAVAIFNFEIRLSEESKSDNVFHYTGLEALKAFSEGGKFRLYNASYMNDPQEGEMFFDTFDKNKDKCKKLQDFFYGQNENILTSAYVASFLMENDSEKQKNGDLMLWRTYGKHSNEEGAGACLKFSKKIFSFNTRKNDFRRINNQIKSGDIPNVAIDSIESDFNKEGDTLMKVLYVNKGKLIDDPEGKGNISKELKCIFKELKKIRNFCKRKDTDPIAKEMILLLTRAYLDKVRFFFKHQAYRYEKEARIVKFRWIREKGDIHEDVIIDSPENKGGMPYKLYMELPETVRCNEVILGPKTPHRDEWRAWLRRQPWRDKESRAQQPIIPVNKSNIRMR